MSLRGIISISGKSGLYKVVAQGKNNVIVESLEDGRKFPAFASNKISALEDISIYTIEDDVMLAEVYEKMYEKLNGGEAMSHKGDVGDMRDFLGEVLPNYDEDRVNNSDVKKLFQWYNILQNAGLLVPEEVEGDEEE
ncbi:DUF5606 family protein [Parvicella tangerina]|uniref:DUF5606 domain-containing protein n=1 Tax=Parvicella tangerina TaxID=2829795 RepID=A0A916JJK5_9FLAO|nr:DUF5606 domain-containing protein [Parvicella tangerina]CAG5077031.1 hypothetical protein CRYO30217_00274 [Parvicella tangerina]